MATLKQANIAREQYSQYLQKNGAHAIGVDKIDHKGKQTFGLIAFCESAGKKIPETLEIEDGSGATMEVPIQTVIAPMAELE
jgi:hypothetical protein